VYSGEARQQSQTKNGEAQMSDGSHNQALQMDDAEFYVAGSNQTIMEPALSFAMEPFRMRP
jgi:hypothetical protein